MSDAATPTPPAPRRRKPARTAAKAENHWFEIPGTVLHHDGVIRLREPAGTDLCEILQQLRGGSYARPFVLDDGVTRTLHFDLQSVQSEMDLRDPTALGFAYTRKMMAFLLFQPQPRHVVIVGLGGGSLTRYCARQLPLTRVTTVEIDADVIGLSELFELPLDDTRVQLVHADAADYFASSEDRADVVLIDGCDRWGTAAVFGEPAFYATLKTRLRPHGLAVINLIGLDERLRAVIDTVSEAFGGNYLTLQVRGGNRLLFAFNAPQQPIDWPRIQQRATALFDVHGLDFPDFAQRLQRSDRQRLRRGS